MTAPTPKRKRGRPATPAGELADGQRGTDWVRVNVRRADVVALDELCASRGEQRADLIRAAVREYVTRQRRAR